MKKKIISYYSIFIGVSVIGLWTMILLDEKPPEGKIEMSFHLFSEFTMAVLCLVSGILILMKNNLGKSLNLTGLGMVTYSVLNAAGYYGERNNVPMMLLFIVFFILTLIVLVLHLRNNTTKT